MIGGIRTGLIPEKKPWHVRFFTKFYIRFVEIKNKDIENLLITNQKKGSMNSMIRFPVRTTIIV